MSTAEDEEFYFWEMAVAKAPGMFRPHKGKPSRVTVHEHKNENKNEDREVPPTQWVEFTVGVVTGVAVVMVWRRTCRVWLRHRRG